MDSPAKRRKTSESTGIAVPPELGQNVFRPPRRPSFQSPTRASLARSQPDVLERALSRSPTRRASSKVDEQTDARKFGLRDRKALRPSLNASASPLTQPRAPDAPTGSPNRRPSGIQAFSKPPRRSLKKILPGDFMFGSPIPRSTAPDSSTPEGQLAMELGEATQEADADLGDEGPIMGEDMLEPDLPPTPTQLGLEKAPDRPRGRMSSSPSLRQEKRMRRRDTQPLGESPLKAVKYRSITPTETETSFNSELSMAAQEKVKSRKRSAAELQRLKDEVEELERWAKKIESDDGLKGDRGLDRLLSLLTAEEANLESLPAPQVAPKPISSILATLLPFSSNIPQPKRQASPLPTNPFALQESSKELPYLTVFAPLALKSRTTRSSHREGPSETHSLTFSAPSPFPSSIYNATVVYETSPETQTVVSVSVPTGSDSKKRKTPEALRQWIDTRLENPLLKLDVPTLCWGINRYWECSVTRAHLWAHIDHKYGPRALRGNKEPMPGTENGALTISDLRRLVPHLHRSTMTIKSKSPGLGPRVLLSITLVLDEWTGEPQLRPEISVSSTGADRKIDHETKKLFHALLREGGDSASSGVDPVLRATEGALGTLFGEI
ncbi:uncharacterized protein N7511_009667 [Penicillium nucicola]|uniref:uncharacterized protein n=1 Tax=Penicillium nucicola TaxID=1850975 RepID=UPI002544DB3F|nr:uncharacterized protein N7511_009667 [Penicillium nucicola]KAJ5747971.1 hypothetical protein N7511_009667 [Penicillium nucicola]